LVLCAAEYATGSRDGEVGAAIGLFLCLVFFPRLRPLLRHALPFIAIALVVLLAFTHAGTSILHQLRLTGTSSSTNGSDYQRTIFRHVAEQQISARPIAGVGWSVDADAQNIYLQLLASGGIIAAAAFLALLAGLGSCVLASWRGPVREEAIAIGIAIVVWLVNGWYNAQLADKYLYVLPGILIACAWVSTARAPARPVPAVEPEPELPLLDAAPAPGEPALV
jgi:O-antigen ligase